MHPLIQYQIKEIKITPQFVICAFSKDTQSVKFLRKNFDKVYTDLHTLEESSNQKEINLAILGDIRQKTTMYI